MGHRVTSPKDHEVRRRSMPMNCADAARLHHLSRLRVDREPDAVTAAPSTPTATVRQLTDRDGGTAAVPSQPVDILSGPSWYFWHGLSTACSAWDMRSIDVPPSAKLPSVSGSSHPGKPFSWTLPGEHRPQGGCPSYRRRSLMTAIVAPRRCRCRLSMLGSPPPACTSLLVHRVRAKSDVPCGAAAYDRAMLRPTDLRRFLLARRIYLLHAAVALALVFLAAPRVNATGSAADHAVQVWWIFSAVMVAGLLIQHRWPLPALLLTSIGATAHQLALGPHGLRVEFPALLDLAVPITLYTLASRTRSRRISMAALAVVVVAEIAVSLINPVIASSDARADASQKMAEAAKLAAEQTPRSTTAVEPPPTSLVSFSEIQNKFVKPGLSVLLALALAYALGDGNRNRRAHLRTLQQRAADLEREQHQRVALAAATERARISRELHDVTAHSLSVIVAQAQAALAAQHRHPERTTWAMREVITVGRDSLSEMRRIVGALGPNPDPDHSLAPQPGIAALPALADRVRAAGTAIHLNIDGPQAHLPAGVDLSAYRIVQEALTNTLKHAGAGAHATVHLAVRPDYVDIYITDDGAGHPAAAPAEPGNGLRGIAERVHLLGGKLTIGPVPNGGFTVRAQLPITPEHPTQPKQIGAPA